VTLLAAIAGAGFAARQILLHITPGDAGYGSALFGYHYYTWAFIGFVIAIALAALVLLFERQFAEADLGKLVATGWLAHAAVWLVIALVALNVVSTLLECGFTACPDNPVSYRLLKTTP
jgi:predicted Kef-type K+ transport protein